MFLGDVMIEYAEKEYEESEICRLFKELFRRMARDGKLYLPDRHDKKD